MRNLRELSVTSNNISQIDSLGYLIYLRKLNLSHNSLTSMDFVSENSALQVLNLNSNLIARIPEVTSSNPSAPFPDPSLNPQHGR